MKHRNRLSLALQLTTVILPLALAGLLGGSLMWNNLSAGALARRQEISDLAARALEERLSSLLDLSEDTAAQVDVSSAMKLGEWQKALNNARRYVAHEHSIAIDHIFLADSQGIQRATDPQINDAIGISVAQSEWYIGASAHEEGYIANVNICQVKPRHTVIGIAIQVRDPGTKHILGTLLLQQDLDALSAWSSSLELDNGDVFFVDRLGNAIGLSGTGEHSDIVNLAGESDVARVLSGQRFLHATQGSVVSAAAPVPQYGWGVIYREPSTSVFAGRNKQVTFFTLALLGIMLFMCLAVYRIEKSLCRQEHAEDEEETSQKFLSTIIENIPNMIFVKDATSLKFVRFNRAGEELLGIPREELIGKSDHDFFPEDQAKSFIQNDRTVLDSGKLLDIPEEKLLSRNSGLRWLHTRKVPILDANGVPLYLLGISEDITKQKETEQEKNSFVSIASHQLRTPLATIRWSSELLGEKISNFSDTQKKMLGNIQEAVRHMIDTIQTLLRASNIDMSTLKLSTSTVDIGGLLDDVCREHAAHIEQKGLKLIIDCPEHTRCITDPILLREVLAVLVSNAAAYSRDGGSVTIRGRVEGGGVYISVADHGIGIPASEKEKIFTKLFRASNALETEVNGTGLGLFIARSLIERLGGTIRFDSKQNVGTTFHISLPLHALHV